MDCKTLAITGAPLFFLLSTMFFRLRRTLGLSKAFLLLVILSYILLTFTASKPCSANGMHNPFECDSCGSRIYNPLVGFQDTVVGDARSNYAVQSPATHQSIDSVCTNSRSFCFLSPLGISGSRSDILLSIGSSNNLSRSWSERNWSSDYGMFELQNGRRLLCSQNTGEGISFSSSFQTGTANENYVSSCKGPILKNKDTDVRLTEMTKLDSFNVSYSMDVEISPKLLDWEERFLFFPSIAFLTVANKCNSSILHVYEPFSTDKQFYPCNHSEVTLLPGETALICFMYLPKWLGLSSAHLVLQTNRGGFLIQAKGSAVESPYGIQPLVMVDAPSNPWSTKRFYVFNPLNETLYVEELTAWIMVSSENASYQTKVACVVANQDGHEIRSLGMKDRLVVKSSNHGGFQSMAVRPCNKWEIGQHDSETLMEMDSLFDSQRKISGFFCMQLQRFSEEHTDTIMFPFEVDMDKKAAIDDTLGPISVSLEPLVHYDATEMVMAISLKNNAPYVLTVVNISGAAESELFSIRYNEGLLLFPGTLTQVALITCAQMPSELHESSSPLEVSDMSKNCRVLILTNDSISSQIEILCRDVLHICSKNKNFEQNANSCNKKTGSLSSNRHLSSQFKAVEGAEPDELILRNWKSQGSSSKLSVLKEHEIFFPLVEIGTYRSKWITVKNPSQEPVMMQLILNSGEIIDECEGQTGLFPPFSFSSLVQRKHSGLRKQGFSIAENAVTEAYVHPHSEATFGPIDFHPSDRCRWRSSALIRNGVSGVEWLSLKGFGGLLSLTLLEGSKPVRSIEFSPNLPIPLNISRFGAFFRIGETAFTCSQPLFKELFVKNIGDLPLEVESIRVSGKRFGLDGFTVHHCKGFFLEPGESRKFQVSYRTDFSASVVHGDLELVLPSGVLVTPMKSSLPVAMLSLCKKSVFWVRLKKFSTAILLAASLIFLVFHCAFFHDHQFYENHKKGKFCISAEFDCLLRSIGEDTLGKFANGQNRALKNDGSKGACQRGKPPASVSAMEVSDAANKLSVKTGNVKKKHRKKKKGMVSGLTGLVEVSSSQSGNSTPTSPISPVASRSPSLSFRRSPEPDPSQETRNRIAGANPPSRPASITDPAKPKVPVITDWLRSLEPDSSQGTKNTFAWSTPNSKPASISELSEPKVRFGSPQQQITKLVLSHSATFPSRSSVSSGTRYGSPLGPHARAPGSNLCDMKPGKERKKTGTGKYEYMYDIWGDHLSALHLMDRFKEVNEGKNTGFGKDESVSFFVKGPQTFLANSHPRCASCFDRKE